MTWLPWAIVLLRHLFVGAVRVVGAESAWREHCATVRTHWEARP